MTAIADLPAVRAGVEAGVPWRVILGPLGNFVNGYAQLPAGHPWRQLDDCTQVPVDVHGGLTYGGTDYWVGFDTGHAWDVWTDDTLAEADGKTTGWEVHHDSDPWNRYWTLDAVEAETRELARQIAAAPEPPNPTGSPEESGSAGIHTTEEPAPAGKE